MKLPVLQSPRVDASICAPCGGRCCKKYPGITAPEDWGAPDRAVMEVRLAEALGSGRYAIDWWDGDPRPGEYELERAEFVRPAVRGAESALFDPSWGGPCTFLSTTGCDLEHDARPRNCRALAPVPEPGACVEVGEDGRILEKRDYVIAWVPYIDLLLTVAAELRR